MQHEPKITKPRGATPDEWQYSDGDVHAVISSDLKSYCEILEFSSLQPGKGNGRSAVEWMGREYKTIHVNDPGNEIDAPDAFKFWRKLAESGLINGMIDRNSNPIFDEGEWVVENIDPEDYPDLHRHLTDHAPSP